MTNITNKIEPDIFTYGRTQIDHRKHAIDTSLHHRSLEYSIFQKDIEIK
jgi:hypothetical protein